MNIDDILYAPLGMQPYNKELIWEMFLSLVAPELLLQPETIADLKQELWDKLDEVGHIEIKNANQLRKLLIP